MSDEEILCVIAGIVLTLLLIAVILQAVALRQQREKLEKLQKRLKPRQGKKQTKGSLG